MVLTLPSKSPFWPHMNTNRIPMNKERSNYIIQVGSSAGYFLSTIKQFIVRCVIYSIYYTCTKGAETLTAPPPVIARAGQLLEFQRRVTKESIHPHALP